MRRLRGLPTVVGEVIFSRFQQVEQALMLAYGVAAAADVEL